jgi:hypothetical protein
LIGDGRAPGIGNRRHDSNVRGLRYWLTCATVGLLHASPLDPPFGFLRHAGMKTTRKPPQWGAGRLEMERPERIELCSRRLGRPRTRRELDRLISVIVYVFSEKPSAALCGCRDRRHKCSPTASLCDNPRIILILCRYDTEISDWAFPDKNCKNGFHRDFSFTRRRLRLAGTAGYSFRRNTLRLTRHRNCAICAAELQVHFCGKGSHRVWGRPARLGLYPLLQPAR